MPESERLSPWPSGVDRAGVRQSNLVALNRTAGSGRRVYVMSDAPRLAMHLHRRFPWRVLINPLTALDAQDGRSLDQKAAIYSSPPPRPRHLLLRPPHLLQRLLESRLPGLQILERGFGLAPCRGGLAPERLHGSFDAPLCDPCHGP